MNTNPKTEAVTARIIFRGVMLACINAEGHYEVGMVQCPSHKPRITILKDGSPDICISQDPEDKNCLGWPEDHDLEFRVNHSETAGVSFQPIINNDTGFHRVLDLEGFLLHRAPVTIHKAKLQGRRLAVTSGKLYTAALSRIEFDLFTWTRDDDPGTLRGHIGFIAQDVGLNVQCRNQPESGIEIFDIEARRLIHSMPAAGGKTYDVLIENDCRKARKFKPEIGTDFRFFYQQGIVSSSDGFKFDLGEASAKRSPDACENTFLGRTHTLGIKSLSS